MVVWSLEPHVRRFFEAYGPVAHRLRYPFIFIPILLTLLLSLGALRLQELRVDDPSYVFTPTTARWRTELKIFTDNWPLNENKFLPGKSFETKRFINVLIKAKDGGNILRDPILKEIKVLNGWIMNNISVPTYDGKFELSYQDLCLSYDWICGANEHIEMLIERKKVHQVIDLTFPRGGTKDNPVYLGTTLGDVTLFPNNTVETAKITQLFYFLKQEQKLLRDYSSAFSYAVERFLLHIYSSDLIELSMAHYQSLQDGLDENAKHFAPNFVFSFATLSFYALACSFTLKRGKKRIDWLKSKPWVAVSGLATTLLAIGSGFGCLLLLGVNYNVINTIIPFLIISIGIDDMFIMVACWESSDSRKPVPQRISQTLAHAGVAITITNVTDILSFAIGCITDLPGIRLFCLYTWVTILFCYVYQLTFVCGWMAVMGEVEAAQRHSLLLYKLYDKVADSTNGNAAKRITYPENLRQFQRTPIKSYSISDYSDDVSQSSNDSGVSSGKISPGESKNNWKKSKCAIIPNTACPVGPPIYRTSAPLPPKDPSSLPHAEPTMIVRFFSKNYAPFILQNSVRAITILAYFIYVIIALYGCMNFQEGLNPANLVTNDHYIAKYFTDIKAFWKKGPQLHVAVLAPPSLIDERQRNAMLNVISSLENTPYTLGREGTVFFLIEYMNYLEELNAELENTEKLWKTKLLKWLKYTGGASQWQSDIKLNKTTQEFEAYRFTIAMKNIVEPNDHKMATKMLREIADKQPFQIEIFHEAFPFADQYLIILPATAMNIGISLICMGIVSFLLVPSIPSGVVTFISIVSIAMGVFGYMTIWGVKLDAVSMISIIMSIGFAVDLSAHIIYAFVTSHGDTRQRVIGALEALGWPIFQGASSTIAGVSILYTVNAYIILTFFKTIWLTMVIGMLHGLLFIPIFLSFIPVGFFRIHKSVEMH
ncbi:unnamed protein product, partial [Mesorhabditis belari]|uniref:SSD domain-containing protein n=1 Tax=Mesorhabditis belari TaxID=2138241 RepID=A0AAF3FIE7_9BILA